MELKLLINMVLFPTKIKNECHSLTLNKKWQSQQERFQKHEAEKEELTRRQKKI